MKTLNKYYFFEKKMVKNFAFSRNGRVRVTKADREKLLVQH